MHLKQNKPSDSRRKVGRSCCKHTFENYIPLFEFGFFLKFFKIVLNYLSSFFNIVYRCKAVESKYGKQKEQTKSF